MKANHPHKTIILELIHCDRKIQATQFPTIQDLIQIFKKSQYVRTNYPDFPSPAFEIRLEKGFNFRRYVLFKPLEARRISTIHLTLKLM
jgi:hypothetical protein